MSAQSGVVVDNVGGPFHISNSIPTPTPSATQLLCKPHAVAINPVDWKQADAGFLVTSWPAVLGCDTISEVVSVGADVKSFKLGDLVCGCTRLGASGYAPYQDTHLYDAAIAIHAPRNFTPSQCAALGVGSQTAGLGVYYSLNVPLPPLSSLSMLKPTAPTSQSPWALVMGGATIVGLHGIQFLRLAGYRIISTNSPKNNKLVTEYGAEANLDYKMGATEQLQEINRISAGHLKLVLHAVEGHGLDLGVAALTESKAPGKRLATVENDMSSNLVESSSHQDLTISRILLGTIGIDDKVNEQIGAMNPVITALAEKGLLKAMPVHERRGGWEVVAEAVEENRKAKGGSAGKVVVVLGTTGVA